MEHPELLELIDSKKNIEFGGNGDILSSLNILENRSHLISPHYSALPCDLRHTSVLTKQLQQIGIDFK